MLRDYQKQAVNDAMGSDNGILVLPTGSGKSHVIAGIVEETRGKTIVLQPTKEILESNLDKIKLTGIQDVGVFSASMGIKTLGKVTYATIGSIIKIANKLTDVGTLIIDECHLTNAKGGQYLKFIEALQPKKLIGLTATPYRLHSNSYGSQMKVLNRTRPKIYKDIIHVTQSDDLVKQGHLRQPEFIVSGTDMDLLKVNSTGAEYDQGSIEFYFKRTDMVSRIGDAAKDALSRGLMHLLVFVTSLEQADLVVDELNRLGISAGSVSSKSTKGERESALRQFRSGQIQAMVNVGVLLLGYDFPRLDCIICARPTMSLALHYQLIGRCVRPHLEKKEVVVYDLVRNFDKFGNPLDFRLVKGRTGLYCILSSLGRLTGRIIEDGPEIEEEMEFGKYYGTALKNIPDDYLEWYLDNVRKTATWHMFDMELIRRSIWPNN